MTHRSWLLVPSGDVEMLAEAATLGADMIVLDLGAPGNRSEQARSNAQDWLARHRQQLLEGRRPGRWVRISALDVPSWREDLAVAMAGVPDGIVLPRAAGPLAVQQLAAEIYELEQRNHIPSGTTRIMPQVSDTPSAALAITDYVETSLPRLAGLIWNASELAAALGASRTQKKDGEWSDVFRSVRATTLLAARARGVIALEMMEQSGTGAAAARAAVADGFAGLVGHGSAQICAINEAFADRPGRSEPARPALVAL